MQSEMEKHMAHLQQLKDFDETLALEREEKARQEQERRRMEVKTWKTCWKGQLLQANNCVLIDIL